MWAEFGLYAYILGMSWPDVRGKACCTAMGILLEVTSRLMLSAWGVPNRLSIHVQQVGLKQLPGLQNQTDCASPFFSMHTQHVRSPREIYSHQPPGPMAVLTILTLIMAIGYILSSATNIGPIHGLLKYVGHIQDFRKRSIALIQICRCFQKHPLYHSQEHSYQLQVIK
jgi:hypothetical protein